MQTERGNSFHLFAHTGHMDHTSHTGHAVAA